jgi:hypothetical protein
METPQPPVSRSKDIANAITFAGLAIAAAVGAVGFGVCLFVDSLFHRALPWIH